MKWVIRYYDRAALLPPDAGKHLPYGAYLKAFDPEAMAGRGWAVWTENVLDARTFETYQDAYACWQSSPASVPRQPRRYG